MLPLRLIWVLAALCPGSFSYASYAQDAPQPAVIKDVDTANRTITIEANGQTHQLGVTDQSRFRDAAGAEIRQGLKDERIKEGTPVMFLMAERDGRKVLVGMRLGAGAQRRNEIQQGRIARLDLDKMTITISAGGKDIELGLV